MSVVSNVVEELNTIKIISYACGMHSSQENMDNLDKSGTGGGKSRTQIVVRSVNRKLECENRVSAMLLWNDYKESRDMGSGVGKDIWKGRLFIYIYEDTTTWSTEAEIIGESGARHKQKSSDSLENRTNVEKLPLKERKDKSPIIIRRNKRNGWKCMLLVIKWGILHLITFFFILE